MEIQQNITLKDVTDAQMDAELLKKQRAKEVAEAEIQIQIVSEEKNIELAQKKAEQKKQALQAEVVEPANAEKEMVREVLDVVLALAKEGRTMVIVTHEMQFAKAVADRMVFLESGKIVEEGNPKDFFENPQTDRLKQFLRTFTYESASDQSC